tara:strand:- start:274 stop:774 length:501 start_codon:yes stop_codon:yes gene_type:complete
MNENNTINRDKLRNIFLMHQADLETNNPEFAKSIRSLLGFKKRNNMKQQSIKKLRAQPHDIDKDFAKDISQKFFKTFSENHDLITQNTKSCTRHSNQNTIVNGVKHSNLLKKKERKHQTQTLKPTTNADIKIPNKYFCTDCGIHHYAENRECEHCGEVHKHCCEVY